MTSLPRRDRQNGQILLLIVAVISMLMAGGYAAVVASIRVASRENNAQVKQDWLESAADRLSQFYEANAATIDGQSSLPWSDGASLAQAAGIDMRYRAALEIGNRQTDGDLRYRVLTLWIPDSTHSGSDGFAESKALAYELVSGAPVERHLSNAAQNQLTRLSNQLVGYYAGRIAADPAHNGAVNYWQSSNCGSRGAGDWQCHSTWTRIDRLARREIGLASDVFTNPWGLEIQGKNTGSAVNDDNPPYTLVLRSRYPWSGAIETTVVQPIGST